MTLDARIYDRAKERLVRDYHFRESAQYLRGGKCPQCDKRELYAPLPVPRVIRCGRLNKCGFEADIRDLYPDLFADWSEITRDDPSPTAAADAYLLHARGFDLLGLREAYSQERYHDRQRDIGSATVRFALPNGSWWERLIDRPERFGDRKANFSPKRRDDSPTYQGHVWLYPGVDLAACAAAEQIWFVEGVFDAIALEQGDFRAARDQSHPSHLATSDGDNKVDGAPVEQLQAASLMSCNNWPEAFLRDLRVEIAGGPTPTKSPALVFALDVGKAGADYTRKFVAQARQEGWKAQAAHIRLPDEPGAKLDWNDLLLRERLGYRARQDFLWHGDVLVAADEREKAYLIWERHRYTSFPVIFDNWTWWASFPSPAKIADAIAEGFAGEPELSAAGIEVKEIAVAKRLMSVELIANCSFRALYFERHEVTDSSSYWFAVSRPGRHKMAKASFPGSTSAGSGDFKKRLVSVVNGAIWTGDQYHLDRIMQRQLRDIPQVTSIEFTGYCRDHATYVFGDLAVSRGRVHHLNEDGYFDVGKTAIKLRTSERLLDAIEYDPDKLDTSWLEPFYTAWGAKGLVLLTFLAGNALFAEQIRAAQKSLGFLEVTGLAGSGKSTAIEFLWKLFGRDAYEGFDAAKSTQAGIARELAKAANMPIVFIEGDRDQETPHSKRFDWEETKTLFNGRATRTRGVKSDGLETYSPPFRGAFVIVQNEPVNASRAVLERIMAVHFDKSGWSAATKAAAERIENWPIEEVSGFVIHAARREAEILERYRAAYAEWEKKLLELPGVTNGRLAKNHAQLIGMLEALPIVLPNLQPGWIEGAQLFIETMCVDRHRTIAVDHPHIETFWDRFDYIEQSSSDASGPLNHHRDPNLIAINLPEFEQRCGERRLQIAAPNELRKLLKTSKRRPFVSVGTVNSVTDRGGPLLGPSKRETTPRS